MFRTFQLLLLLCSRIAVGLVRSQRFRWSCTCKRFFIFVVLVHLSFHLKNVSRRGGDGNSRATFATSTREIFTYVTQTNSKFFGRLVHRHTSYYTFERKKSGWASMSPSKANNTSGSQFLNLGVHTTVHHHQVNYEGPSNHIQRHRAAWCSVVDVRGPYHVTTYINVSADVRHSGCTMKAAETK